MGSAADRFDRPGLRRRRWLALAAAAAALPGCALRSPPDVKELTATELAHAPLPANWRGGGVAAEVQPGWLKSFDDPRLPPLADEALTYNADLRIAAARVEVAAAALKAAGGAQWPELNLSGRSGGKATGSQGQLSGLVLSASWELDLWGRVRAGKQAADAQFASARADELGARQAIVASLAKAWFLAGETILQKRLITDVLTASETIVRLAQDRLQLGIGAEADVALARADLQSYRDSALQIDLVLLQSRRALEVILGRYPAAELELPAELPAMPPPPATGVPSELLERRPDIVAAERRFAASFARVEEARAARLPRISLSAALSSISSSVFVLQNDSDPSFGGAASVFFPIFNAGQLEAQVELRTAEQKQAGAAFAQTALRAFNEVETALASEQSLSARELVLRQGLTDSRRALELEQVRFRVGSRDLRTVTQQQLAAYAVSMSLLRVQTEQRVQRVQLHLALGGDFAAGS